MRLFFVMSIAESFKKENFTCIKTGFSVVGSPFLSSWQYIIDDTLFDAGCTRMCNSVIAIIQSQRINKLVLTHQHEDHSGNAKAIIQAKNIVGFAPKETCAILEKGFPILPYQYWFFNNTPTVKLNPVANEFYAGKYKVQTIPTPGHSTDHHCYYLPELGIVIGGDIFVAPNIKYFRKGERFNQQIKSFKEIINLDFDILLCGHNPQFKNGKKRMIDKMEYFENLRGNVLYAQSKGLEVNEIIIDLKLDNKWWVPYITLNDVSLQHMIQAILDDN